MIFGLIIRIPKNIDRQSSKEAEVYKENKTNGNLIQENDEIDTNINPEIINPAGVMKIDLSSDSEELQRVRNEIAVKAVKVLNQFGGSKDCRKLIDIRRKGNFKHNEEYPDRLVVVRRSIKKIGPKTYANYQDLRDFVKRWQTSAHYLLIPGGTRCPRVRRSWTPTERRICLKELRKYIQEKNT
ncbi:hypothetical protein NQ317_011169, partial [Molorchus minor]